MVEPVSSPINHIDAPKGTQAIIRALHLLKMIAAAERDSSLTELATELDLSPSTTHRILTALESEGLIEQQSASRRYTLGPSALTIGAHALYKSDLRALARPILQALARTSGETATLEIPVEGQMLILDEISGPQIIGARIEVGTRWPAYATSTGRALLAELSDDELEIQINRERESFTAATLVEPDALRADIIRIRKYGYSAVIGELESQYSAVGAAVYDATGRAVAALSIGGPSERLDTNTLNRLGHLLVQSARELSTLLSAR